MYDFHHRDLSFALRSPVLFALLPPKQEKMRRKFAGFSKPPNPGPGSGTLRLEEDPPANTVLPSGPSAPGPSDKLDLIFSQLCTLTLDRQGAVRENHDPRIGTRPISAADVDWLLLGNMNGEHDAVVGKCRQLSGEDFVGCADCCAKNGAYLDHPDLAVGKEPRHVWCYECPRRQRRFCIKRIPGPLSPEDSLRRCVEIGYALCVHHEYSGSCSSPAAREELPPTYAAWFLTGDGDRSRAAAQFKDPSIFIVMDQHGSNCGEFTTIFLQTLPMSEIRMSKLFWNPNIDNLEPTAETSVERPTDTPMSRGPSSVLSDSVSTASPMATNGSGRKRQRNNRGHGTAGGGGGGGGTGMRWNNSSMTTMTTDGSFCASPDSGFHKQQVFPDQDEDDVENAELFDDGLFVSGGHKDPAEAKASMVEQMIAHASPVPASESSPHPTTPTTPQAIEEEKTLEAEKRMRQKAEAWVHRLSVDHQPWEEELLCVLAQDVLTGLHKLHTEVFLMHNDIKGPNIVFSSDKMGFSLIDFDCALPVNDKGFVSAQVSRLAWWGNSQYKPPELYQQSYDKVTKQLSNAAAISEAAAAESTTNHHGLAMGVAAGSMDEVGGSFTEEGGSSRAATPYHGGEDPQDDECENHETAGGGGEEELHEQQSQQPRTAPECYKTTKCDIYCFAALLLEFRLGRKPRTVWLNTLADTYAAHQSRKGPKEIRNAMAELKKRRKVFPREHPVTYLCMYKLAFAVAVASICCAEEDDPNAPSAEMINYFSDGMRHTWSIVETMNTDGGFLNPTSPSVQTMFSTARTPSSKSHFCKVVTLILSVDIGLDSETQNMVRTSLTKWIEKLELATGKATSELKRKLTKQMFLIGDEAVENEEGDVSVVEKLKAHCNEQGNPTIVPGETRGYEVQCVVLQAAPGRIESLPKIIRGKLVASGGGSITLETRGRTGTLEGKVPLLGVCGTKMVSGTRLISIEKSDPFGRVEVINMDEVSELDASDELKSFLYAALTFDWEVRPAAKVLLQHEFLRPADAYRPSLPRYLELLDEAKEKRAPPAPELNLGSNPNPGLRWDTPVPKS